MDDSDTNQTIVLDSDESNFISLNLNAHFRVFYPSKKTPMCKNVDFVLFRFN